MDLATGKYTAHESVDLGNYITNIPITDRLTPKDRKYIADRWSSRLPPGTGGIPKATQVEFELNELLKIAKGKKLILEIGTDQGGTLYNFLQVADEKAEIISVDLPNGLGNNGWLDESVMQSWKKSGQKLHIIKADSHDSLTLEKVKNILNGRKFDFTFIDGDHTYDGVKKDYEMYGEYSNIVAFHDIVPHVQSGVGVKQFWDEITGNKTEIIENTKQGWGGIGVIYMEELCE